MIERLVHAVGLELVDRAAELLHESLIHGHGPVTSFGACGFAAAIHDPWPCGLPVLRSYGGSSCDLEDHLAGGAGLDGIDRLVELLEGEAMCDHRRRVVHSGAQEPRDLMPGIVHP